TSAAGRRSRTSSSTPTTGRSPRSSRPRGFPLPPDAYAVPAARAVPRRHARRAGSGALGLGLAILYMSVIVLIPLAAVVVKGVSQSPSEFWQSISNKTAVTALAVTLGSSAVVAVIGAVM